MSEAVFPVSAATLQLWFDPGTFQRARAYWQAGKVIKLEYSEDLSQISAQVWGEALSPYRQFLSLKPHGAEWRLTDSCSCPVGGRCKHVLAVLLKWLTVFSLILLGMRWLASAPMAAIAGIVFSILVIQLFNYYDARVKRGS